MDTRQPLFPLMCITPGFCSSTMTQVCSTGTTEVYLSITKLFPLEYFLMETLLSQVAKKLFDTEPKFWVKRIRNPFNIFYITCLQPFNRIDFFFSTHNLQITSLFKSRRYLSNLRSQCHCCQINWEDGCSMCSYWLYVGHLTVLRTVLLF